MQPLHTGQRKLSGSKGRLSKWIASSLYWSLFLSADLLQGFRGPCHCHKNSQRRPGDTMRTCDKRSQFSFERDDNSRAQKRKELGYSYPMCDGLICVGLLKIDKRMGTNDMIQCTYTVKSSRFKKMGKKNRSVHVYSCIEP